MKQNRLSLNDVEWGEFLIGGKKGIFNITSTKSGIDKNKLNTENGDIPYITRTDLQNGINLFITENQTSKYKKNKGNVITIGLDTQTVFYQENSFLTGQNIQVLDCKHINKKVAMFIIPLLKIQMMKFNWGGNGATLTRLKRTRILLPKDSQNKPNWQFMEEYIKQEQKEIAQKVVKYYEQKMLETSFDLVGLEGVEWKNFRIGDLFKFVRKQAKGLNNLKIDKEKGISYLGATNRNNGVLDFVESNNKLIYSGNGIAFIRNGEGSMGYSVYKKEDFIATQDISVGYNSNLNQYNGQFITTIADRVRGKYNFSYKRNQKRLENEILTLPVNKNGEPHWEYMSKFMKKIEAENLGKVLEYIYIYIYDLAISQELEMLPLNKKEWKEFWIEDIATIKSGKDIYERERVDGKIPYITATAQNNGVGYFVDNINKTLEERAISVNRNGSVGYAFYHDYKALYGNDTRKLIPKYKNKYASLFLTSVITRQKEKYGYGYKMGTGRLKRQKILLPTDKLGNIDFDYMKKYMQIQEIKENYKILNFYKVSK